MTGIIRGNDGSHIFLNGFDLSGLPTALMFFSGADEATILSASKLQRQDQASRFKPVPILQRPDAAGMPVSKPRARPGWPHGAF